MGKPVDLTDADFEKIVLRRSTAVLDFWVTNCQPCSVIAPMMEEFAEKYADRLFVGKIRADQNPKAVGHFNITTAPTILIIDDGSEVDRITLRTIDKTRPKEYIEERIKKHMK